MSDYTPTQDEVFEAFAQWNEAIDPEDFRPKLDRFIAKVKADAWEEVAEMADRQGYPLSAAHIRRNNPYRIEREA